MGEPLRRGLWAPSGGRRRLRVRDVRSAGVAGSPPGLRLALRRGHRRSARERVRAEARMTPFARVLVVVFAFAMLVSACTSTSPNPDPLNGAEPSIDVPASPEVVPEPEVGPGSALAALERLCTIRPPDIDGAPEVPAEGPTPPAIAKVMGELEQIRGFGFSSR